MREKSCTIVSLCYHMDCSPPGFSVHGILQARTLEWVAIPFSRGSSWLRNQTQVCISGRFSTVWATAAAAAKSLQSCPTLSDPMDCSLPGSSIHGIFQARVWVAIAFFGLSHEASLNRMRKLIILHSKIKGHKYTCLCFI